MPTLFSLLSFLSLIYLIVGLIKPSFFNRIFKKELSRKDILKIFWGSFIVCFFAFGLAVSNAERQNNSENAEDSQNIITREEVTDKDKVQSENQKNIEIEEPVIAVAEQKDDFQPVADSNPQNYEFQVQKQPAEQKITEEDLEQKLYTVESIVDGDTIKINIDGSVETLRLIGIDTPETVDSRKVVQCFGIEASNKAKELLFGQKIRIESDPTQGERDIYGRLLIYVYRKDGLFFNKYMIEQGYAHEYTYNIPYKYQFEFKVAEKSAQDSQRGLWSPDTCNGDTASSVDNSTPPTIPGTDPINTSSDKY